MSHTVHTNTYMYKKQVSGKSQQDKKKTFDIDLCQVF